MKELADNLAAKVIFTTKDILTSEEAAKYMGISISYLYKLTHRHAIPYYKPRGKMCYFRRNELDEWLLNNRVSTATEIDQRAQAYCMRKGGAL